MNCTDRYGHDLQIGDKVVVVEGIGEGNLGYVYQIENRGEFQNVTILFWHPYLSYYPGSLYYVDANGLIHTNADQGNQRKTVIKCPECGRENRDTDKICPYCGAMLIDLLQTAHQDPLQRLPAGHMESRVSSNNDLVFQGRSSDGWRIKEWGKWFLPAPRMNVVLSVQNTDRKFVFNIDQGGGLTIGYKDPESVFRPDIDLHDVGAVEKGVSRQHATIVREDDSFQIIDSGAPNGTYLNGQKLGPGRSCVLRDGDDIRLGHLVLHVSFQRE